MVFLSSSYSPSQKPLTPLFLPSFSPHFFLQPSNLYSPSSPSLFSLSRSLSCLKLSRFLYLNIFSPSFHPSFLITSPSYLPLSSSLLFFFLSFTHYSYFPPSSPNRFHFSLFLARFPSLPHFFPLQSYLFRIYSPFALPH